MTIQGSITAKLRAALAPVHIDVVNESAAHAGEEHERPASTEAESHFRVVVVSSAFEGLSPVARHKLVYAALADEIAAGLHALGITARTPAEWAKRL